MIRDIIMTQLCVNKLKDTEHDAHKLNEAGLYNQYILYEWTVSLGCKINIYFSTDQIYYICKNGTKLQCLPFRQKCQHSNITVYCWIHFVWHMYRCLRNSFLCITLHKNVVPSDQKLQTDISICQHIFVRTKKNGEATRETFVGIPYNLQEYTHIPKRLGRGPSNFSRGRLPYWERLYSVQCSHMTGLVVSQ